MTADLVKFAWLQAGFLGVAVVLAVIMGIVAWKIINTLWEENKALRLELREADRRNYTVAEASKAVQEKLTAQIAETNALIRTLIGKAS